MDVNDILNIVENALDAAEINYAAISSDCVAILGEGQTLAGDGVVLFTITVEPEAS